jgi:hypothetical protein
MVTFDDIHGSEKDLLLLQEKTQRRNMRQKKQIRYVYFVEAQTLGLIKIGWTHDVKRRMVSLQIDCPVPIKLLGTLKEEVGLTEGIIHRIFKQTRIRGEWFRDHAILRQFIEDNKMGRKSKNDRIR